jgi:hypothetical protein
MQLGGAAEMQPESQNLPWRHRAILCEREGINRKAGRREGPAGKRERIFAFGGPKSKIPFLEGSRRIEGANRTRLARLVEQTFGDGVKAKNYRNEVGLHLIF